MLAGPATRLAGLAARRTVPIGLALAFVLWFVLVAIAWPSAATAQMAAEDAEALERGLAREHAWSSVLLLWVPAVIVLTLRQVGPARARERAWLESTPLARPLVVVATWLGALLAASAVVLLTTLAIELAVGESGPAQRLVQRLETPTFAVANEAHTFEVASARGSAPHWARLDLRALESGRIEVELEATATGDTRRERVELETHRKVSIELPPGAAPVTLSIRRADGGALFVVPSGGIEVVTRVADDRATATALGARAAIAMAAWLGLALGLGSWLSPPLAFLSLVSFQLAAALADEPLAFWPGVDLGAALARVGRGELPPTLALADLAPTLAVALVGLALGMIPNRRGSRA